MFIKKLVKISLDESPPCIDVTDNVLYLIRMKEKGSKIEIKTMGVMAIISAVAASIVISLSVYFYHEDSNPMMEIFRPVVVNNIFYE